MSESLKEEVETFLHREGRLLDEDCLSEWLGLFTEDATYWIPRQRHQSDPLGVPSIIYDDRPLLAMRVQRLAHAQVYAAEPRARMLHIIGSITVESRDDNDQCWVLSAQLVIETRGAERRFFASNCRHVLRRENRALRIAAKRVELIDCDAVQEIITMPL